MVTIFISKFFNLAWRYSYFRRKLVLYGAIEISRTLFVVKSVVVPLKFVAFFVIVC